MVAQWSITLTAACELSCGPHPLYQIDTLGELWLHDRELCR